MKARTGFLLFRIFDCSSLMSWSLHSTYLFGTRFYLRLLSTWKSTMLRNRNPKAPAYTYSSPLNTPKEDNGDTNLTRKVVLELNINKNSKNVFVATNETVIDDQKIPEPDFGASRVKTITDFIQGVANILNTNDNTAFTTEKPEVMYKSDLKSKLVQRMLFEESTGRLPTVQPTTTPRLRLMSDEDLRRSIAPLMPGEELSIEVFNRDRRKRENALVRSNRIANRHGTTSNEDTQAEPVMLRKATPLQINSIYMSDKDLRRSRPLPEKELAIDVFDREERKGQESFVKSNSIATVQQRFKDYIKRMRFLQNKVIQLKKMHEYNQNCRINVISNGYRIKNESEVKKGKNKVREPKRDVNKTNSANEDEQDTESNKEIVKNYDRHTNNLKNKKKTTRSETTKATKSTKTVKLVKVPVHRSLEPLSTAKNNAGSTTVNDNTRILIKTTFTITKKVGNATVNVTKEVKQKRIDNNATYDYATKDDSTRRYRRVLEFSSPPLYDQPFQDQTFREGLHPANMSDWLGK